jgi:hypothetical protein
MKWVYSAEEGDKNEKGETFCSTYVRVAHVLYSALGLLFDELHFYD